MLTHGLKGVWFQIVKHVIKIWFQSMPFKFMDPSPPVCIPVRDSTPAVQLFTSSPPGAGQYSS